MTFDLEGLDLTREGGYFDCKLIVGRSPAGRTMRGGVLVAVKGHALSGPTTFPVWRPETFEGERAIWRVTKGWIIVARGAVCSQ